MEEKCKFYDDGHGNGSYMPGASCGPPSCRYSKKEKYKYMTPNCDGNLDKCYFTVEKVISKINQITELENKLNKLY